MQKKSKDINVELLRVIACLLVIGVHLLPGYVAGDHVMKARMFMACICSDSVIYFWFIMGFFLFRNKPFKQVVTSAIKTVVIPAAVFVVATEILNDWITGNRTFIDCITVMNVDWKPIIKSVLSWNATGFTNGSHLWYVFSYMIIILWLPIVRYVCVEERWKTRVYIYIFAQLYLLIQLIQQAIPQMPTLVPQLLPIELVYVILGYDIYLLYKKRLFGKKAAILGLLIFFMAELFRMVVQSYMTLKLQNQGYLMCWNTFPSMFAGVGLTVFILSIPVDRIKSFVLFISGKTYPIFLLHWVVIRYHKSAEVFQSIIKITNVDSGGVIESIAYQLLMMLYVFVCSLVLATLIHACCSIFRFAFSKIINKTNFYKKHIKDTWII